MMLNLTFFPTDDILDWANEVVGANKDCRVILSTHAYLRNDGTLEQENDKGWVSDTSIVNCGQEMYDKLVEPNSNIVMVLCGHNCAKDNGPIKFESTRADGTKVVQMMINHQGMEADGNTYIDAFNMLAMLYFSEDGNTVQLEFFSANNGLYYMDKFQFDFTLDTSAVQ